MAETKIKTPEYSWNRFKYSGAAPPPTRYAVSFLYDGKMYVFGGLGANKKVINTLSYLDLEKKRMVYSGNKRRDSFAKMCSYWGSI